MFITTFNNYNFWSKKKIKIKIVYNDDLKFNKKFFCINKIMIKTKKIIKGTD